jgi:LuxR family maltose regulon positive regulatory protein
LSGEHRIEREPGKFYARGDAEFREDLAEVVLDCPAAGICVVLAGRSDPPLGLARLRARGQLTEVRGAELGFTPAEAAELLQHAASALPGCASASLWTAGRSRACRGVGQARHPFGVR